MASPQTQQLPVPSLLLSGASGMIGSALVRSLTADRMRVTRLVRGATHSEQAEFVRTAVWDPTRPDLGLQPQSLGPIDAAIHLSGSNVADRRWTPAYKQEIVASRIQTTEALVGLLLRMQAPPKVLICASAIGIYGDRGDEVLTEASAPGTGFLADTCVAWEAAALPAERAGIRVVHLRFGVVLSPQGGALKKMLPIFRLGLGGNLGSGRQWMPWLTLRDAVGILRYALENVAISGPVNAVAPNPSTNADFTRALSAAVHRPAIVPAPAFALRLTFGKMADEALLASARVIPGRLSTLGYRFADPELAPALRAVLVS